MTIILRSYYDPLTILLRSYDDPITFIFLSTSIQRGDLLYAKLEPVITRHRSPIARSPRSYRHLRNEADLSGSCLVSYFIGHGPAYFTGVCPYLFYWLLPGRCHPKPSVRANDEKTRWGRSRKNLPSLFYWL